MITAAVIVAAGRGLRFGGDTPKQYLPIGSRSVLRRSIDAYLDHPGVDCVQTVIRPGDRPLYEPVVADIDDRRLLPPAAGGESRMASSRAGLEALAPKRPAKVLIHDGARCFVGAESISAVIDALDRSPGAMPALPVVDALWRDVDGYADALVPRDDLRRAQTPQGFRFGEILAAHRGYTGTALDDAEVARAAGLDVRLVPGDEDNFKITTAADLARGRDKTGAAMDIRVGNGFDVHAFGPGNQVTLLGVAIPFERGLVGHSDADVAMHAVTDAIYGALAEGDIGQWFPPSEPRWKGVASATFLEHAVERAAARGYSLSHLDCTIVCEAPQVGPHAAAMRAELGRIGGLATDRISVKATTSERLGFVGRGEGIATLATATLVRT